MVATLLHDSRLLISRHRNLILTHSICFHVCVAHHYENLHLIHGFETRRRVEKARWLSAFSSHRSDKAKDIPKISTSRWNWNSLIEAVPFETAETNTYPSSGRDHQKYVATSNKIPLEQKHTFPTIWSRTELGDEGRNSCPVLACQSHLVDIFTRGRSDLVSLVLSCLEFASMQSKVARLSLTILLYWCSLILCVFFYGSFAFFEETSPPGGKLVAVFITMTDCIDQVGVDCRCY